MLSLQRVCAEPNEMTLRAGTSRVAAISETNGFMPYPANHFVIVESRAARLSQWTEPPVDELTAIAVSASPDAKDVWLTRRKPGEPGWERCTPSHVFIFSFL